MKRFSLLLIPIVITACSKNNNSGIVDLTPEELDSIESESVIETDMNYDCVFGPSKQLCVINDSLLLILGQAGNGNIAHVLSTDGTYLNGFGKIGQGPNEYIMPISTSISTDNDNLYIYDLGSISTGVYDTKSDATKIGNKLTRIKYDKYSIEGLHRFFETFHFNDSSFIGFGASEFCRILSVNNGRISQIYTDYPSLIDNPEHNRSAWNNGAKHAVSPDGKHIVCATWIGMAFEILTNSDGIIESKIVKNFHEPIYKIAQGAKPVSITAEQGCFIGFRSIYATNNGFYGVVYGSYPDYGKDNIILYFDYEGNLKRKLKIKSAIDCIAINKNVIYALAHDNNTDDKFITVEI